MARDVTQAVEQPSRFDFRWARAKAFALLLAQVFDQGKDARPAHHALAEQGANALKPLRSGKPRSNGYELFVLPQSLTVREVRDALSGTLPLGKGDSPRYWGFPDDSAGPDLDRAMEARERHLSNLEREFVESLGLRWVFRS